MDLINSVVLILAALVLLVICVALICALIDIALMEFHWHRVRRELHRQSGRKPARAEVWEELIKRWKAWDTLHHRNRKP